MYHFFMALEQLVGISLILQDKYFWSYRKAGCKLPPLGEFAVGMFFVHEKAKVQEVMNRFAQYAKACEMEVLFWRVADVNNSQIGTVASSAEPVTLQVRFRLILKQLRSTYFFLKS